MPEGIGHECTHTAELQCPPCCYFTVEGFYVSLCRCCSARSIGTTSSLLPTHNTSSTVPDFVPSGGLSGLVCGRDARALTAINTRQSNSTQAELNY
jgi:hypothetical protein